jgi:hypothetical protein
VFWRKAAYLGEVNSQFNMFLAFWNGTFGLPQNHEIASLWLACAAKAVERTEHTTATINDANDAWQRLLSLNPSNSRLLGLNRKTRAEIMLELKQWEYIDPPRHPILSGIAEQVVKSFLENLL